MVEIVNENFITYDCYKYCWDLWREHYDIEDDTIFLIYLKKYEKMKDFAPHENIHETNQYMDPELHFMIRCVTGFYMTQVFKAMKIDLSNPNVKKDIKEGNIGTPGRIAKIMCGSNLNDDRELGSGRFSKKPRMARFPNTNGSDIPITKRVDIISSCSHHFIVFGSIAKQASYAVISYIPEDFVLGISKLQRITNWIALRYWLQEDLTKALYDEISNIANTKSVYVGLFNLSHGCASFRGVKGIDDGFTTEHYGGKFKTNPELIPK